MDVHIQLEERVDDADELYRASGNMLLDRLLGATLHSFPVGEDEAAADAALDRLARRHCQLVEDSALLPREIDAPDRS